MAATNDSKVMTYNTMLYFWTKLKAYFAKASHDHYSRDIKDIRDTIDPNAMQTGGNPAVTDRAVIGYVTSVLPKTATASQEGIVKVDNALSATSTNPVQNKAVKTELDKKSPLASPTFTGVPAAPTPAGGDNSTKLATTAFVRTAIGSYAKDGSISQTLNSTNYTTISSLLAALAGQCEANKTAIAGLTGIDFQVVDALPDELHGKRGVIYLVPLNNASGSNAYKEYIFIDKPVGGGVMTKTYEQIGTLGDIDMSQYWNKTDLIPMTNAEIDAIMAA